MKRLTNPLIMSTVAILFIGAISITAISDWATQDKTVQTHLTIYLDEPILSEGGGIIVAARPIAEAEWLKLSDGFNPADSDQSNPKRAQVQDGDRHFGAVVSSSASAVEFFYPENGSYTFNILPKPGKRLQDGKELQTEATSDGSREIFDPETGQKISWLTTTIFVHGNKYDVQWVRLFNVTFSDVNKEEISVTKFLGSRVLALSKEAVEKYVVNSK